MYHWIPLLNRFDEILEEAVKKYNLKEGPQTIPWEEKHEELVCGVLAFSRVLVEGCGNRSLYASSAVSLSPSWQILYKHILTLLSSLGIS